MARAVGVRRSLFRKRGEPRWDGMCPEGKHGADFPGQPCKSCIDDAFKMVEAFMRATGYSVLRLLPKGSAESAVLEHAVTARFADILLHGNPSSG